MPTENRSSNTEQMVSDQAREHWDKLNALPRYMFLLRPSGSGVQKLEDRTGNWIDVHDAQAIVDTAQEQINDLRALLNQPASDGFSAGDMADQGAKSFRDGQRALVLPARELYTKYLPGVIPKNAAEVNRYKVGWNACLEEVSRLNAAAIAPE